MAELEKANTHIRGRCLPYSELGSKADELQVVAFENEQLRGKLAQGSAVKRQQQQESREAARDSSNISGDKVEELKRELAGKEVELQRSKALNHELSLEFDKSVAKICEFERELSFYRKENHELKKTLSLFVEREQYDRIHRQRLPSDHEDEEEED